MLAAVFVLALIRIMGKFLSTTTYESMKSILTKWMELIIILAYRVDRALAKRKS